MLLDCFSRVLKYFRWAHKVWTANFHHLHKPPEKLIDKLEPYESKFYEIIPSSPNLVVLLRPLRAQVRKCSAAPQQFQLIQCLGSACFACKSDGTIPFKLDSHLVWANQISPQLKLSCKYLVRATSGGYMKLPYWLSFCCDDPLFLPGQTLYVAVTSYSDAISHYELSVYGKICTKIILAK